MRLTRAAKLLYKFILAIIVGNLDHFSTSNFLAVWTQFWSYSWIYLSQCSLKSLYTFSTWGSDWLPTF